MIGRLIKWGLGLALVAGVVAGLAWSLRPQPEPVDVVRARLGPMTVTISEDGATRVREVWRISAPIGGRVARSLLEVGDRVEKGRTVVATILPGAPPFMDARARREAEARVEAARAAVKLAEAELARAKAAARHAEREYKRALRLATGGTIPEATLDRARLDAEQARAQVATAEAQLALRKAELASAEAALIGPGSAAAEAETEGVDLVAPIDGVVLSIAVKSETVVPAGTLLAELGDPRDLEVAVDLLSADAVRVKPGTPARITGWGGPPLPAHVRRIDPAGFVKVSALGIEERRVNAVLALDRPDPRLGHGFQVTAEIITWQSDEVLRLPLTALFRPRGAAGAEGEEGGAADAWAVYAVEDGIARLRRVRVGHVNDRYAEILEGLEPGALVVDFPPDRISDGTPVVPRR